MTIDRHAPATLAAGALPPSGQTISAWRPWSARGGTARLLFAAVLAVVAWIVAAPLLMLIYSSFTAEAGKLPFEASALTLANYVHLLADPKTYELLSVTAAFTVGSTAIGVSIAIVFAWLIERTDLWLRKVFFVAILIPMAIPNMIYAMAWIQLLNPNNGLLNVTLERMGLGFLQFDIYSLAGMIILQGITLASHGYLLIAVCFRTLDASWEEQSYIAGRRLWGTMLRVTLPMLKPALLAAALFFTIVAMETFDIPVTLGMTSRVHVISTQIYWSTRPETGQLPDYGTGSALSVLLVVIALGLIHLYQQQIRNARRFVTVTGRGYRQSRIALGKWRLPLFICTTAFVLLAVMAPLLMLVWRSLLRFYMYPSPQAFAQLSFNAYRSVFNDADAPAVLRNTAILALGSAAVVSILAAAIAWQVLRGPVSWVWRRGLNTLAFAPQAFPSIVIGLALIFTYLWVPIPIYSTIWILVLAMVTKYLAYSTGTMIAAQMQISGELEEASKIAGAGGSRTYWRIVVPLITPALAACFLWVMIHVVRELGLALMLYSLRSQVLSTKVWLLWENGRIADACATGILTVIALLVLLALPAVWRSFRRLALHLNAARGVPVASPLFMRGGS
jgi:iron(III) transport system permease protein